MRKRKSLLTMSERMFTPVYLLGQPERVIRQYWDNIYKERKEVKNHENSNC